jgi:hypothetical protein
MMNSKTKKIDLIPAERIINQIYFIRGQKVMFDRDLAELYGVEVRVLNQAVKRNSDRFPIDFMFQLNQREADAFLRFQNGILDEDDSLRSQIVILKKGRGQHLKYRPFVFTEQGVAMLSAVLKSKLAVAVSIQIVRTFVKLREMLIGHKDLKRKIETMERKYDSNFKVVFKAIARLIKEDTEPKRKIGFGEN